MKASIYTVLLFFVASIGAISVRAQTVSPPPNYPDLHMGGYGEWNSVGLGTDVNSITVVLGVDLSRYVTSIQTIYLNGGSTEQDAAKWQRFANAYPLTIATMDLENMAGKITQLALGQSIDLSQVLVRLVVRTGAEGSPLQEHLIESFTCTQTEAALCTAQDFHKLPGFSVTPWQKEHIKYEFSHAPPRQIDS